MFTRLVLAAIAVFTFAAPALAADVTFRGEVHYDERRSVPPEAKLWVSLVSLPSGATIASASAPIGKAAQPALAYTLNVRSKIVEQGGSFGLLAQIRSGYRVIFRSQSPVPVNLTELKDTPLTVRYSPDPAPTAQLGAEIVPPLLDTLWTVASIGGTPVLDETKVTFAIAADYRAGGHGGCNNYFTEASFADQPLSFGPVVGTRMACADNVMKQETALFAALETTANYRQTGDSLQLLDAAGIALIELVRSR
ncbi:META domain-containing protein [Devosia submarina]|uniref:META domain-containing protein n=1 Tax=Devosia submarina TaxID=1173082 RepID=UPI000D3DA04F|nr:META domain-containing protein [Devosia submarina]